MWHLQRADISLLTAEGRRFCPKSIRSYNGEKWILEKEVNEALGEPVRPNPLQHVDERTTRKFYARRKLNDPYDKLQRAHEIREAAKAKKKQQRQAQAQTPPSV